MQEQDNTLSLIDRLSELLAYLLELKNQGKFQQAIELIDDTFWRDFNFDSKNVNQISEEFINDFLQYSQKGSPEIVSRLGDLFNEKGDLLFNQNRFKESKDILSNALTIYFYLNDNQDFFSFERMNKMEMINRQLSKIDLKIDH
jgi:tetratricopeptide (TPR) repeat protein